MIEGLAGLGRFALFGAGVAWRIVTPWWEVGETSRHVWQLVARCFLPVVAVVFPFGMVMALQGLGIFAVFGAQRMLSSLVSVAVFRELSPVLACTLVAAQGGSAFAAELGAMRIQEELDATEIMAIDSLRAHVVPRVVAALLASPVLVLVGSISGIAGGFVTAVYVQGEPEGVYWANLWALTSPVDVAGGLVKAFVFGGIIGLVACYQGYFATGGAAGVGRAVNNAVVIAVTVFVVVNYFLTTALFGAIGVG
ncbi:MAG: ABC transporter permease [Myxococcales bacterium]|nr:ABC transporter permease [Myxococcales bacterium]